VYMTTQWGSISRAIQVSTDDGKIKPLKFALSSESANPSGALTSQAILGISKEGAVVAQSEPGRPMNIGVISHDAMKNDGGAVYFCPPRILAAAASLANISASTGGSSLTYQVINMSPDHGKVKAPVQGILLLPDNPPSDQRLPMIVVPHGGPHSCTSTSYVPSYAYLCTHGKYAILHVNYRGSIGFGQDALESLAGDAGDLDVRDCVHATKHVLDLFPNIDPERVGICGGSHGGYLAGHCIGQFPELFKVSAMRNPVTNIATMTTSTDIVDWCAIETFGVGSYDWTEYRGPGREELGAMWDASPIAHINNVKAPTLVALGMADRRVPPSQGLEYYHSLRSKGIATKLLVYERDDHAIDRVVSEADHWINIKRWFDEHL
jgi:acylaminoacyl-peptidase